MSGLYQRIDIGKRLDASSRALADSSDEGIVENGRFYVRDGELADGMEEDDAVHPVFQGLRLPEGAAVGGAQHLPCVCEMEEVADLHVGERTAASDRQQKRDNSIFLISDMDLWIKNKAKLRKKQYILARKCLFLEVFFYLLTVLHIGIEVFSLTLCKSKNRDYEVY